MKIIGVGGNDGSGKDTVAEVLAEHGWLFISVTDILREEATHRGIRLGRDTLRQISAEWRREHGMGVLVDKALEVYKAKNGDYKGLVVASLRHPGEAERVHELGGQVVWVDADPKIRYERIMSRKRGTEDEVTFQEFQAEEATQSDRGGDEAALSLNEVRAKADLTIENNGDDLPAFKAVIQKSLDLS